MLNRNPSNTSNVINSYRKRRQQRGPFLVYGAIGLVIIGGIMLVVWFTSPGRPLSGLFPTETPTPTLTLPPTNTAVPTSSPTVTMTPTETLTPTPSAPFPYIIQEGDSLFSIADRNGLGNNGILFLLLLNPGIDQCSPTVRVGETILVPNPGAVMPTSTPVSSELPRGTRVTYLVQSGDTLAGVAGKFNSTTDDILKANDITDPNLISVGQCLTIPINLITPTPTLPPTSTPVTPTVAGQPTATPTSSAVSQTCAFDENATFVTELQTLINDERVSNGLSRLSVNAQLAAAAKAHAIDLLCHNSLNHEGSDGTTPELRVQAQGFTASLVVEDLYASQGATPQSAFDWWINDPAHKADLLNASTTVFGVAYVSSESGMLGSYFVVVSARP